MIKEINEIDFKPFFSLMAEVECGSHFDFQSKNHIEWLEKKISKKFLIGTKFFAYYIEDIPVGFAAFLIDEGPEGVICLGQKCELVDIGIFPEYRDKGYGSELLKSIEEYAKEKEVYCLYISTAATDYKVIAFYGKNGYIPVATLPDVHGPGDEGVVFMRKILK